MKSVLVSPFLPFVIKCVAIYVYSIQNRGAVCLSVLAKDKCKI